MPKKHKISEISVNVSRQIANTFNSLIGHKHEGMNLHQAIQDKNYELITEILADKKIDPNARDSEYMTPLYYAFKQDDNEIINALLDHPKIDVNLPISSELTPLQTATLFGREKLLKLLLPREKININIVDENKDNVLAYAIYSGSIESVKILLTHPQLNLKHQNIFGATVLHIAAMNKKLEIMKLLLKKPDILDNFQHVLLKGFKDESEIPLPQLNDFKEIFQYGVLLSKKEINNISNKQLKDIMNDIHGDMYEYQYGRIKSANSDKIGQNSVTNLDQFDKEQLLEGRIGYELLENDNLTLSGMLEEL
jgi:ankyrin repeat protein